MYILMLQYLVLFDQFIKKKSQKIFARLLQDSNLRGNFPPHFECGSLTTRTNSRKIEHILIFSST